MKAYHDIAEKILAEGQRQANRTGTDALAIAGMMFEHDMADGFPLLTTKKIPFRLVASELEFFVRGITDKEWLRSRGNGIWDEWCSPDAVPYATDAETKARMMAEREMGPIYGWQWRRFGAKYVAHDKPPEGASANAGSGGAENAGGAANAGENAGGGVDQLAALVEALKKDSGSRRMIVSAWNPADLPRMALPPCHYAFQATVIGGRLNLLWNQRSVDVALGLPFNIASYGCLLHLLAKEASLAEGKLIGFLGDTHIYVNHIDGIREQMARPPRPLPKIRTDSFSSIFEWRHTDTVVEGYDPHPAIKFEIAV